MTDAPPTPALDLVVEALREAIQAAKNDELADEEQTGYSPESAARALLQKLAALAPPDAIRAAEPAFTTGHCENHRRPGGCQLHNLQCGWPDCDRKPAPPKDEGRLGNK